MLAESFIYSPMTRNKWQSNCWRSTQNNRKKVVDSLITGDETWVHFYEPKRKVNRLWALKHAKRPSIAKWTLTAKKLLYAVFFRNSGPLMQSAVLNGRGVSGNFYKTVVLKTLQTKMRVHPKRDLQHVNLIHDIAPAHKSLTVTQFWSLNRSMYVTPPSAQTWPSTIFSSFRN